MWAVLWAGWIGLDLPRVSVFLICEGSVSSWDYCEDEAGTHKTTSRGLANRKGLTASRFITVTKYQVDFTQPTVANTGFYAGFQVHTFKSNT